MNLGRPAVACLVLGVLVLVPFEKWWTIAIGVGLLLAWVVLGTLTLTGPGAPDEEEL